MNRVLMLVWNFVKAESTRKFVVEVLVEIISGVVSKVISGGASGPRQLARA